jgi:hypothetical protein
MADDDFIGIEGRIEKGKVHAAKEFNVELNILRSTNSQTSANEIIRIVNQNPDILITDPEIDQNKIRFVVASGSSSVTTTDIVHRFEDFGKMYSLPLTSKNINVTEKS